MASVMKELKQEKVAIMTYTLLALTHLKFNLSNMLNLNFKTEVNFLIMEDQKLNK